MLLDIVTPLHKATKRDYLARMNDDKVHCMGVAKQYGKDYWDGDRRYGYGGYKYIPGRWKSAAERLIKTLPHLLKEYPVRVLDVGCGKGFQLVEFRNVLEEFGYKVEVIGFDISDHALNFTPTGVDTFKHNARDPFPFDKNYFDLVISVNCLHNLKQYDLALALGEITRVSRYSRYVCVESYRNDEEQFNMQCWALTCERFHRSEEWIWLYRHFGYTGDYEFIYFE